MPTSGVAISAIALERLYRVDCHESLRELFEARFDSIGRKVAAEIPRCYRRAAIAWSLAKIELEPKSRRPRSRRPAP